MKRSIALFLTLAMLFVLLPTVALATDAVEVANETALDTELAKATSNIKLTASFALTTVKNLTTQNATIDLNGQTLTATIPAERLVTGADAGSKREAIGFYITGGSLTIKDSVGSGKVIVQRPSEVNKDVYGVYIEGTGTFTLESGTLQVSSPYCGYGITAKGNGTANSAVVNISGGAIVITGSQYGVAIVGNGSAGLGGTDINISSGTITANELGIYHPQAGTLDITGGTINAVTGGIVMKSGALTMTNGSVNVTGAAVSPVPWNNGANGTGAAIQLESNAAYSGSM